MALAEPGAPSALRSALAEAEACRDDLRPPTRQVLERARACARSLG
jgi:hypothetical protein